MITDDNASYFRFTGRQRLDKAMHSLEGLVRGIAADGRVNKQELYGLTSWLGDHLEFAERHPFNEVIPRVQDAVSDGMLDDEERCDILWLCEHFTTANTYFDVLTADISPLKYSLSPPSLSPPA